MFRHAGRVATILALGFLCLVPLVRAQSENANWEKAAGGKMSFEVASVKPDRSGPTAWASSNSVFGLGDKQLTSGVLRATNVPLITFIAFAYKLDVTETRAVSMELPQWARHPFYDIEAQPPGGNFTKDQVRLMMRSLLADRFKLAVHFETKDGPAYVLALTKPGKLGSGMRAYPDGFPCSDAPAPAKRGLMPAVPTVDDGRLPASCGQIQALPTDEAGTMRVAGRNLSMDMILDMIGIEGGLDRPLVDRTGLSGTFDLSVDFSRQAPPSADVPPVSLGTTFVEAMTDQLGLKLTPATAPVDMLVVDHIAEPTPN